MKTSSCIYLKVSIIGVLPTKRVYYTLKHFGEGKAADFSMLSRKKSGLFMF